MANKTFYGQNSTYQIDKLLTEGGEGFVLNVVDHPDWLIKVYKKPTKELEDKIRYMVNKPPLGEVVRDLAWPTDAIYDENKHFVGFAMHKLCVDKVLQKVYSFNPGQAPLFSVEQKVVIAINICKVVKCVHDYGYIVGDFNPLNIGINSETGHVAFFDTDSYHFLDEDSGHFYKCVVAFDGCLAPELLKRVKGTSFHVLSLPTFDTHTDDFALAIHIFRLLMNGYHPFCGVESNANISTASPGLGNKAIERDNYCFKDGLKPLSALIPDIELFPLFLKDLFHRAFVLGTDDPSLRPTADEWLDALTKYHQNLISCKNNPYHQYYLGKHGDKACPYCDAEQRYNLLTGQLTFKPVNITHIPVVVPSPVIKKAKSAYRKTSSNNHKKPAHNVQTTTNYAAPLKTKVNKKTFHFNCQSFLLICLVAFCLVGIPLLSFLHEYFSYKKQNVGYESTNFVVKILSKENIDQDDQYSCFRSNFSITNNYKRTVSSSGATLVFRNNDGGELSTFDDEIKN